MGSLSAYEMAQSEHDRTKAMTWHLTVNHFPPLPVELVPVALEVVETATDPDRWTEEVQLPADITWRGQSTAPVWACVDAWHLDPFIAALIEEWHRLDEAEMDAYCEEHGHGPDCPHDPTDWDSITKERWL